ncbi:MAG: DUF1911 domain-containing protein [Bacteroidetes bacterium]|nr:DUF1911 domain-containing protein [Bacteroidota bacterium]
MVKREVFFVESGDAAVAFRAARIANLGAASAIAKYQAQLFLAIAGYGRGDALADVRAAVRKAVQQLESDSQTPSQPFDFQDHAQFYATIWGLSLSMLFGDPSNAFLERGAGQDAVFDTLLKFTGADIVPTEKLIRPLPYAHWLKAAADPKNAAAEIQEYLRLWYAGMSQTPWHDTHIHQDPAFFGYWAFELAALVKAADISDSGFSDNIFYPRDLVHQRLFRTWLDGAEGEQERQIHGFAAAQEKLEAAKATLLAFFEGTSPKDNKSAKAMGDSLKMMSQLLGLSAESLKEKPELLRVGMTQLLRTMLSISKDALDTVDAKSEDAKRRFAATFKEIQEKLGGEGSDLAEASKILAEHADISGEGVDPKQQVEAAKTRLETVNEAFSGILKDQSLDLQQFFEGIDRLFQTHAKQLGITPPQPYNVYENMSKDVSKALDEANKKNMIQSDFDWSSLWKKD